MSHRPLATLFALLLAGAAGFAAAETTEIRFAKQTSIGYVQFNILEHQKLIEKHARALGLSEIKVTWVTFNGPDAMNTALLAGDAEAHAFVYRNGKMDDLGTLGGTFSIGFQINNSGDIVGDSYTDGDAEDHAFMYRKGKMTDLGTLGGFFSSAHGINGCGETGSARKKEREERCEGSMTHVRSPHRCGSSDRVLEPFDARQSPPQSFRARL